MMRTRAAQRSLLIGFLPRASFPDSGAADAEAIKRLGHGHKSRRILSAGVMSEHGRPAPGWNMYNNAGCSSEAAAVIMTA